MPSWKKIIVSGSNAELNQLTATSYGGNISGSSTSTGSFGRIDSIGLITGNKLAIGTTSPDYSAHIVVNGNDRVLIQNLNAGSANVIELKANAKSSFIFNDPSTGHLFIRTDTAAEDVILQNNSSGNVGIGNLSEASEKLHVVGNVFATGNISGSLTSTGSFGKLLGDGSSLTGISATADIVDDTSPQLGGNLDLNSNNITGTGNIDILGTITAQNFIVSSSVTSIEYQSISGSTIFGDTADDTHTFLGDTISGSSTSTGSFGRTEGTSFSYVFDDNGSLVYDNDQLVYRNGGNDKFTIDNSQMTTEVVNATQQVKIGGSNKIELDETNVSFVISQNDGGMQDNLTLTKEGNLTLHRGGNVSGSATSTGSFGHLELANRDTDASFEFGRAHIGYIGHSDMAGFSHVDNNSATSFALAQSAAGKTIVQAKSGQPIAFKINNSDKVQISSDGNLGVGIETATEKLHVVGNSLITGDVTIGGDLTINGDTTTISTSNILVQDAFGFFATGSAGTNVDAGIIVQSGSFVDSGSALYHDISSERWSVGKGIASTATNVPDSKWGGFVATVYTASASPVGSSPKYGVGEIHVDDDGEIYIYS